MHLRSAKADALHRITGVTALLVVLFCGCLFALQLRALAIQSLAAHWKARIGLDLVTASALGLQICALLIYQQDQKFLKGLFDNLVDPGLAPSKQLQEVLRHLEGIPHVTNDRFLIVPLFRFLRPTARQIVEHGGDCADRCRLIVVLLGLRGIRARKWAIYSPTFEPCHAVVEVDTEGGKMVVDPSFALWFPRTGGGFYGLKDLRTDPEILNRRIHDLMSTSTSMPNGRRPIESYPTRKYIFTNARSINWDKTTVSRVLYRALRKLLGPSINDLFRPFWAEQPSLMIISIGFVVELLSLITSLMI